MDARQRTRLSRWLALHLRHHPERIGVSLDAGGWADVDQVVAGAARTGVALTPEEVAEVVATNDKGRFQLDEGARRIRACQGHSVAVDLGLAPRRPPQRLYHGTVERHLPAILAEGLRPQGRQHVHLSADVAGARAVGSRRGRPVVLGVAAGAMHEAGHVFVLSTNRVWLCDHVPAAFLTVDDARGDPPG